MHHLFSRLGPIVLSLGLLAVAAWWGAITLNLNYYDNESYFIDFIAFWAAGKLALSGEALAVWDAEAFRVAQDSALRHRLLMPWYYPPSFHLAVTPFGLFPFSVAYGLWIVLSLGTFWAVLRRVAATAMPVLIVAPAFWLNLQLGNNAILFASCIALAMISLQNPVRSGLSIAAISLKPALGPMIAVAMLAAGRWRIILWVTIASVTMAGVATMLFGVDYWPLFFMGLRIAMNRMQDDPDLVTNMISWYAFARFAGASMETALMVHLAFAAGIAVATIALWRTEAPDPNWRAACLALAVSLTSPHAFYYEMVFALVALAFMIRAGIGGVIGTAIAIALWAGPLLHQPLNLVPLCTFAAPVLSVAFAYSFRMSMAGQHGAAEQPEG